MFKNLKIIHTTHKICFYFQRHAMEDKGLIVFETPCQTDLKKIEEDLIKLQPCWKPIVISSLLANL